MSGLPFFVGIIHWALLREPNGFCQRHFFIDREAISVIHVSEVRSSEFFRESSISLQLEALSCWFVVRGGVKSVEKPRPVGNNDPAFGSNNQGVGFQPFHQLA
jgi:hypothetical protein